MKFRYSSIVEKAIAGGEPVVALESTVIAHGLPYPQNLETAMAIEAEVSKHGAVPATVAIIEGVPTIGLDKNQIENLATAEGVRKISMRDLPLVIADRSDGATTVATTMFFAHRAGIKVFATGGIGGIHRGEIADVSADLPVLASTPMTTVCAGAKIVLNLPETREWLETHGVTILGWQTDKFPAFYSRKSELYVDTRVETIEEICRVVEARNNLNLNSAILIAVPVPKESEIEFEKLESWLTNAIEESISKQIAGKDITPFLLSRLAELSEGRTTESNIALLLNNAGLAARIACGLG